MTNSPNLRGNTTQQDSYVRERSYDLSAEKTATENEKNAYSQMDGNWKTPEQIAAEHTKFWNEQQKQYAASAVAADAEESESNNDAGHEANSEEEISLENNDEPEEYREAVEDKDAADNTPDKNPTEFENAFRFTYEQRIKDYGLDGDVADSVRKAMEDRLDSLKMMGSDFESRGISKDEIRAIAADAAEKSYSDNRPIKLDEGATESSPTEKNESSPDLKKDEDKAEQKKESTLNNTLRSLQVPKVEAPNVPSTPEANTTKDASEHSNINQNPNNFFWQRMRNGRG